MPADEFQCWKILVQMVAMVFNCCHAHGWTYRDIEMFSKLAWHHDVMVEEVFGLEACVITEQNLIHVADNIFHFSSPDNYWVFDLQRAVKRYVNQSTNHRNIEKTYSDNETRREVLQNLDISRKGKSATVLTQKEIDSAIKMRQVSSLSKGNYLIAQAHDSLTDIQGGILIGRKTKDFKKFLNLKDMKFSRTLEIVEQKSNIALLLLPLKDVKAFEAWKRTCHGLQKRRKCIAFGKQ